MTFTPPVVGQLLNSMKTLVHRAFTLLYRGLSTASILLCIEPVAA